MLRKFCIVLPEIHYVYGCGDGTSPRTDTDPDRFNIVCVHYENFKLKFDNYKPREKIKIR